MKTPPRSLLGLLQQMNDPPVKQPEPETQSKPRGRGLSHYTRTKPCRHCGGHLFYIKSGRCVPCTIRKSTLYQQQCKVGLRLPVPREPGPPSNRQVALDDGYTHYHREYPCDKCGGTLFYTRSKNCVACHREIARRSAAENYKPKTNRKRKQERKY